MLAAALVGPGCHRTFACEDDAQCGTARAGGRCEAQGYCSFLDDGCDSGRRWSPYAAEDFADECLSIPDVATGSSSSTGDATSSSGTSSSTTDGTDSSGSTTGPPPGPCDPLLDADPIVVTEDGTTIEHVRIESDGEPGIRIEGATGVTIRDVEIHHRGAPGIVFATANGLTIENVIVIHDGAPAMGPHAAGGQANIEGRDSTELVIEQARVSHGSSLIDLENTPAAQLRFIEGHDVRGPGAAAFVRLHESDDVLLEDFSVVNPLDTGRPQTLIQITSSSNVTVRRGLMDGHNAEFGYGVGFIMIPGQHSGGLVEDVDAVRMTNGSFSCFPFGTGITFRNTRARDNICEIVSIDIEGCGTIGPNGGCVPGSGGVSWAASTSSSAITIESSTYFNLCSAILWPMANITVAADGLTEEDFELRAPIEVSPCWEP